MFDAHWAGSALSTRQSPPSVCDPLDRRRLAEHSPAQRHFIQRPRRILSDGTILTIWFVSEDTLRRPTGLDCGACRNGLSTPTPKASARRKIPF